MSENSGNVASDAENAVSDQANDKGVGTLLRESRENNDQTLGEVATILRIRQPYLEALEEGRFADLPGHTYAVGFIRAYAEYLGLDSTEVVRRFKNEVIPESAPTHLKFPIPLAETGIPSGTLIFFGLIAIVLSYGAWLLNTTEDGFFSDLVSPLPERFANLLPDEEKFPNANETKMVIDSGLEKKNIIPTANGAKEEEKPKTSSATATSTATNVTELGSGDQPVKHAINPNSEQLPERELNSSSKPPSISSSQNSAGPIEPIKNRLSSPPASSGVQMNDTGAVSAIAIPPIETVNAGAGPLASSASDLSTNIAESTKPPPLSLKSIDTEAYPEASPVSEAPSEISISAKPPSISELTAEAPTSSDLSIQAPGSETNVAEPAPEDSSPKSRITVKAIANSWIEIKDDFSNTNLMARLLNKGDTYDVPNQAGLSLHTGNAGALQIMVDGIIVPGIGEVGVVQRGVLLDPDALVAGTAAQ